MNKTEQKNLESNINKLYLMSFLDGLWFATPVFVLILLDNRISLTEIGIILGVYPLMQLLFDIPSSIWADKYSRKTVLVLGGTAFVMENVLYYYSHSFGLFLIGSSLNGIGMALTGGVFSALVYDTLLSLGKEKEYEKTQLQVVKSGFVGKILVSIVGVYIYLINPRAVFLLSVLGAIIYTVVSLYLTEPFREKSISQSLNQMKEGAGFLLKHKIIWQTIVIFAVMSATTDVLTEYYQPILKVSQIPVAYFGIIYFFASIFRFLGASIYPKIKSRIDWKSIMIVYFIIDIICSLFFGSQIAALVLLAVIFLSLSFGSQSTYISNIIHQIVPSSHRATAMSINSQVYMLLFLVFLYVVGFSMDHCSIFIGMLINAVIALAALIVFLKKTYKKSAAVQME